jgi:hypothetical protein
MLYRLLEEGGFLRDNENQNLSSGHRALFPPTLSQNPR